MVMNFQTESAQQNRLKLVHTQAEILTFQNTREDQNILLALSREISFTQGTKTQWCQTSQQQYQSLVVKRTMLLKFRRIIISILDQTLNYQGQVILFEEIKLSKSLLLKKKKKVYFQLLFFFFSFSPEKPLENVIHQN